MKTRRDFLLQSGALTLGASLLPTMAFKLPVKMQLGVQLYTFRDEMAADPEGTLEKIAAIGIKKIETARSNKGHYYGLGPEGMKKTCGDLGMKLVSGHVHLDDQWEKTMEEAVLSGQDYLICSTMPSSGQTVDNYKKVAQAFNKAGESCKKLGLKFGYHNHEYEFETDQGEVLYDILLKETEAQLVHMELDLGWVIVAGKDPLDYFNRFPDRFPLWHLKDMNMQEKESTEFGKGGLNIEAMMAHQKESGVKHIFIEQEEYAGTPLESMKHNMAYMQKF
jgi:sugar phosphate isomerase/epimerase